MSLASGSRLGPYEILSALGAGGMGEVYRARDTKLKRDVAVKVLPDLVASDPDRLARFHREAEVLATLNHPNIAHIYGFEDADGTYALVMELVEGPTLADRITQGPISLNEALPIAKQIAEALEVAHEQGIIHRDLKPANIKVTPDGKVKLLDFGLAKLTDPVAAGGPAANVTASPTLTSPVGTMAGTILGTAAYMAPEQARGRTVDRRADIWAFGCVLYEMLTARRAFVSEEVSDTLAAIILKDVDWSFLPATTPDAIRRLLKRCLEKQATNRLHAIADARLEIDEAVAMPPSDATRGSAAPPLTRTGGFSSVLPWLLAGVTMAGLVTVLALTRPWRSESVGNPMRMSVELGADVSLLTDTGPAAVLSPDGHTLVFSAQKAPNTPAQLYVRRFDQLSATLLQGTDDGRDPFLSPDGKWVAFFAGGKLKKVALTGAAVVTLCDAPNGRGGTWAEDGSIVFSPNTGVGVGLLRVSSVGGKPELLTKLADGEVTQRWPQLLPGAKAVLFTSNTVIANYQDASLVVQELPSGARKVLQQRAYYGRYVSSGHLVYMRDGTLFAAAFDINRLELTGDPVPVLEGVASNVGVGTAQYAASDSAMAYLVGASVNSRDAPIVWMDQAGETKSLYSIVSNWSNPQFSPDGRRLAVDIVTSGQGDIGVVELARDTLSHLTFGGGVNTKPVWTPDGRRIVFSSTRDGSTNLDRQRADGAGSVQRLTESKGTQWAASWHPNGKLLAFAENNASGSFIMTIAIAGDESSGWKPGRPTMFLSTTRGALGEPTFSPDGRWLAYYSTDTGRSEVFVQPYPGPGGKRQVSVDGGSYPIWSRTARQLLFQAPGNASPVMAAAYRVRGDSFESDKPQAWSARAYLPRPRNRSIDLHPDGMRVAMAPRSEDNAVKQDKVVLLLNFADELRRLAPVKR